MSVSTATGLTYPQAYELAFAIRPVASADVDAAGTWTYTYVPDLTTAEQAQFDDLVATYHTRNVQLTLAEYRAIKSQIAEIRAFRTRTLAQWNTLTAAQREADEISYLNDLTDVLRALLRQ